MSLDTLLTVSLETDVAVQAEIDAVSGQMSSFLPLSGGIVAALSVEGVVSAVSLSVDEEFVAPGLSLDVEEKRAAVDVLSVADEVSIFGGSAYEVKGKAGESLEIGASDVTAEFLRAGGDPNLGQKGVDVSEDVKIYADSLMAENFAAGDRMRQSDGHGIDITIYGTQIGATMLTAPGLVADSGNTRGGLSVSGVEFGDGSYVSSTTQFAPAELAHECLPLSGGTLCGDFAWRDSNRNNMLSANVSTGSIALGYNASTVGEVAIAIGTAAQAIGDQTLAIGAGNAVAPRAIQIGTGLNNVVGTTQIKEFRLLDAEGNIPEDRVSAIGYAKTSDISKLDKKYLALSGGDLSGDLYKVGTKPNPQAGQYVIAKNNGNGTSALYTVLDTAGEYLMHYILSGNRDIRTETCILHEDGTKTDFYLSTISPEIHLFNSQSGSSSSPPYDTADIQWTFGNNNASPYLRFEAYNIPLEHALTSYSENIAERCVQPYVAEQFVTFNDCHGEYLTTIGGLSGLFAVVTYMQDVLLQKDTIETRDRFALLSDVVSRTEALTGEIEAASETASEAYAEVQTLYRDKADKAVLKNMLSAGLSSLEPYDYETQDPAQLSAAIKNIGILQNTLSGLMLALS